VLGHIDADLGAQATLKVQARAAGKAGLEALADGIGRPASLHAIIQRPEGEEGSKAVLLTGPVIGQAARCCSSSVTAELAGMPVRPEGSFRSVMRMVQPVSE
jgi:hypothetical protein